MPSGGLLCTYSFHYNQPLVKPDVPTESSLLNVLQIITLNLVNNQFALGDLNDVA